LVCADASVAGKTSRAQRGKWSGGLKAHPFKTTEVHGSAWGQLVVDGG